MKEVNVLKGKIIITKGLPASGKSTWSKKYVQEKPLERIRVCRDDIRRMLGKYWVPQREGLVTKIEEYTVLNALRSGYDVIVDATNFSKTKRWYDLRELLGLESLKIEIKDFTDVPVERCIERDSWRKGDECVGKDVIMRMYNKYLKKDVAK